MIQPITFSNTNFKGNLQIVAASGKTMEDMVSKIPGEVEQIIFTEELDIFKKEFEEATPEDASFTMNIDHCPKHFGNALPYGDQFVFEIHNNAQKEAGAPALYKKGYGITNREGNLWKKENKFQKDFAKFLKDAKIEILNTFNFREAVKRNRAPKAKPKTSLLDRLK